MEAEWVIARLQEEFEDKLHDLWKKVKEKRGVPVLLKHEEDNPIKAGKALGLMPGHPELLLKILQSLDYYPGTLSFSFLFLNCFLYCFSSLSLWYPTKSK